MEQPDENRRNVSKLLGLMWNKVGHFSNELDEYASRVFERPIRGSWRIFEHIAKQSEPENYNGSQSSNPWWWSNWDQKPHYPARPFVEDLDTFASSFFHEVAHGWIYLLTDYEKGEKSVKDGGEFVITAGDRDDEKLCDEISAFVCDLLGLTFTKHVVLVYVTTQLKLPFDETDRPA